MHFPHPIDTKVCGMEAFTVVTQNLIPNSTI